MIKSIPLKWRHYQSEIILLCVRWHLRKALSYSDLKENDGGTRSLARSEAQNVDTLQEKVKDIRTALLIL